MCVLNWILLTCTDGLNTVDALNRLLQQAERDLPGLKETYDDLTAVRSEEEIMHWIQAEQRAKEMRGDALEIYEVKAEKG